MAVDYKKEGRIAIITINRPEAMNALNYQVHKELHEAFTDFRDDNDMWVGILTGAGERAFSAGADLKETRTEEAIHEIQPDEIYKPFIAAINGVAVGGGLGLALACDLRIAAEHARMGQTEVVVGFMPGVQAVKISRLIARAKANELLLMGQLIDAQEAYRIGLVNKVVPRDQLMPTAMQWAEILCQASPLSVRLTKELIIRSSSMTVKDGLQLGAEMMDNLRKTEDSQEGPRAFREKRKPDWKAK